MVKVLLLMKVVFAGAEVLLAVLVEVLFVVVRCCKVEVFLLVEVLLMEVMFVAAEVLLAAVVGIVSAVGVVDGGRAGADGGAFVDGGGVYCWYSLWWRRCRC